MLTMSKYGWGKIMIGTFSERCSYIDDVPFMLLKGFEESCRTHRPIAMKFDAEGWEYTIVLDLVETHIIMETDEGYRLITVDVNRDELAKTLVADIRNNLEGWSRWTDYGDMTEDEADERQKDLSVLCDILERRIPSNNYRTICKGGSP